MFARFAIVLALSSVAFGTVFVTAPVSTTSWQAGVPQLVSWQDDGTTPTLQSFGPAIISIYVGSATQQTLLQTITPSLNVSTAGSVQFTPEPTIGPNSNQYFIRFDSLSLKNPTTPANPAQAFSSKFTMTGMTGTFSPTIQAQINGTSTTTTGTTTTTALVAATPTKATPAAALPTTTPSKSTPSASSTTGASAAKSSSPATALSHSGFVAVAAAAAAIGVALY